MDAEVTIIGAGIIGLSIAETLSRKYKSIYVLERNPKFGMETSSRNSEVIHSGIYYPRDSLKARFCVRGNRLLYELCEKNKIPYAMYGKLTVATTEEEILELERLKKQGEENGVKGLELLSQEKIQKIEPNVKAISAIFSPSTGIINPDLLMRYFEASSKENGVELVYSTEVKSIEKISDGFQIEIQDPDRETSSFTTQYLVNCAGLEADTIAEMAGMDIDKHGYRQYFCKGEYFSVSGGNSIVKHLIYPTPNPNKAGLGIHATLDLGGRLKLGPNAHYIERTNPPYDYRVDESHKQEFFDSAQKYLSGFNLSQLAPDTAGIRPKLQAPDFIINEESDKGFPGLINHLGIESPGLSCCLTIAEYVDGLIDNL